MMKCTLNTLHHTIILSCVRQHIECDNIYLVTVIFYSYLILYYIIYLRYHTHQVSHKEVMLVK